MYGINQHISLGSMSTIHKTGKQRHEWYRKYETYAATWYTLVTEMGEDVGGSTASFFHTGE